MTWDEQIVRGTKAIAVGAIVLRQKYKHTYAIRHHASIEGHPDAGWYRTHCDHGDYRL